MARARRLQAALITLGISCVAHLLFVLGEITLGHATAHAQLAVNDHDARPLRGAVLAGLALVALAALALHRAGGADRLRRERRSRSPGLLAYEHAYVQAGQSVPLA